MKTAGVVRHIDQLGRVVVPIEFRRAFEIESFSDIEIFVDGDTVALKKFVPCCALCRSTENTIVYRNHTVCRDCVRELQQQIPTGDVGEPK